MINNNAVRTFTASALVLILLFSYLVILSPETDSPMVEMRVIGPGMKAVDYGERAGYLIQIRGKSLSHLSLDVLNVPNGWEASLTEEMVYFENGEARVWLFVHSPTVAQAEAGSPLVANVVVRGGNVTVATVTYIQGHLNVIRDGVERELKENDSVLSGDILVARGEAMLHMTSERIYNLTGVWSGDSYLYLSNGTMVGMLLTENGVFFVVFQGKVIVYASGGGSRSSAADRGPALPVIHLDYDPDIQNGFPERNYSAYMDISSLVGNSFFSLNFSNDNLGVDVYTGNVELNNGNDSVVVPEHAAVRGEAGFQELPDPQPLSADIIVVYGDVESDVNVDGRDIHEIPDAHHLPDIDGMDLFILPPDRECTMITEGIGVGGYNLTINRIEGDVTRVFEFSTNTTTGSTDVIKITRSDALSLSSSEEKTYDLSIRYSENGTQQEFNVVDIPISETEEQIVTVIEWYNLSNPEAAPVELMEGDTTVSLSNGMTGEDVKREKTAKDSQGTTISMEIGIILVVVIVIAGFVVYRLNRTSKELMKRLKENERRRKEVLEAMEIGAKAASQLQAKEIEEEKDPRRREDGEQKESTAIKEDSTSVEEENTAVKKEKTELSTEEERASSGKEKEVREEPSREEDDDMEELPYDEFGFD